MGQFDKSALRVRQQAQLYAQRSGRSGAIWRSALADLPTAEAGTRTLPIRHQAPKIRKSGDTRKPSKMFLPQKISYEEDQLRKSFFKDHPWELARPRTMVEDDGKDTHRWDWSKSFQAGRPMNGESVIQRQAYLAQQKLAPLIEQKLAELSSGAGLAERERAIKQAHDKASADAYDEARKELYVFRHDYEVETRVAREEALAMGATFGKTALEVGMELENKMFDSLNAWAKEQVVLAVPAASTASAR